MANNIVIIILFVLTNVGQLRIMIMIMMMIICIHKENTLQIMADDKQQSPDLRIAVESYKKLIWLIIT